MPSRGGGMERDAVCLKIRRVQAWSQGLSVYGVRVIDGADAGAHRSLVQGADDPIAEGEQDHDSEDDAEDAGVYLRRGCRFLGRLPPLRSCAEGVNFPPLVFWGSCIPCGFRCVALFFTPS